MNVISSFEGERIKSVLDETIAKLMLLETVTLDTSKYRTGVSDFIGDEFSCSFREQRRLESRYESLILQRVLLKGMSNKCRYKEVQSAIHETTLSLRESTRNLCRNLQENPNTQVNFVKIQRECGSLMHVLRSIILQVRCVPCRVD